MKLSLWQWIGIALLVIGVILFIREHNRPEASTSTQPTGSIPATQH